MLSFYRQLDLLNRLYILNYCKLELLEATFIAKIPNDLSVLQLKPSFYFDLNDRVLLLSSLSTKRIKAIIDKIILEVLNENNATAVSGVLLRDLINYFSKEDFKKLVNQGARMRGSKFNQIGEELSKYKITDVFYHFVHIIFQDISTRLHVNILERFVDNYRLDSNLLAVVGKLPLPKLLDKAIIGYIPYINTVDFSRDSQQDHLPSTSF